MEAAVLLAMCNKKKAVYGIRTQKMNDGDWWRTWAFSIEERRGKSEGYDITPVKGNLNETDDYPGCPYCGTHAFVQCGNCHKISCYNGENKLTCLWCKHEMKNFTTATEKFSLAGGDI